MPLQLPRAAGDGAAVAMDGAHQGTYGLGVHQGGPWLGLHGCEHLACLNVCHGVPVHLARLNAVAEDAPQQLGQSPSSLRPPQPLRLTQRLNDMPRLHLCRHLPAHGRTHYPAGNHQVRPAHRRRRQRELAAGEPLVGQLGHRNAPGSL